MTLAFSTSSPWASVALLSAAGDVLWSGIELAPRASGNASLELLERAFAELGADLSDIRVFAADVGPGSFTGVRVGVVLAKTLAWTQGARCAGADSFDLIDADSTVALPSRKGEFFVRVPGAAPIRTGEVAAGAVGYGFGRDDTPPTAANFGAILPRLRLLAPEELVPCYLIEASISQPKKPLSRLDR